MGYVHDFERVRTKDGLAEIEFCHIRYRDIKKTIEERGGRWIEMPVEKAGDLYRENPTSDQSIEVILSSEDQPSKEWIKFSKAVLERLKFKEISLEIDGKQVKGYLAAEREKNTARPKEEQCFIRTHAPSCSWGAEYKGWIKQHIFGLHGDLFLYDLRGTYKSTGIAGEGGYYLDIEAIYETAKARGYDDRDIWSSGFCLGGAIAAELASKHPVNLCMENSFNSMTELVANYPPPGNVLGSYAVSALRSKEKEVTSLVSQDDFHSVNKLKNSSVTGASYIILNTLPDSIVPPTAHEELVNAVKDKGSVMDYIYEPKNKGNGHSADPLEDETIWRLYVETIAKRNPAPAPAPAPKESQPLMPPCRVDARLSHRTVFKIQEGRYAQA